MGQAAMGRKRAVLVGINYVGRPDELKGCLNDVARMRRCLVDRFGFDGADIRVLADADPSTPPPTGANIRLELEWLVAGARAGDTLFFHYSGHGLQLPAETGEDDDTGYDECIVPCDGNLIKGLIDKAKEQIGNSTKHNRSQQTADQQETRPPSSTSVVGIIHGVIESLSIHLLRRGSPQSGHGQSNGSTELDMKTEVTSHASVKSRSLPLSAFIEMLRENTGEDDVGVGTIRTTLFRHFGDDASPKVRKFVQAMAAGKLRQDGKLLEGDDGGLDTRSRALASGQEARSRSVKEVYAGTAASVPLPRNGVLISGCQTDQTSGDATTAEGVSYGLLSNAIQTILASNKHGTVTNRKLALKARELLSEQGVTTQQPGLYCSDEHASAPFIC
ncbi:metacaspase-6-like [Panicum miliaceum]|uniref:Metacaspase-6-like n=1 Tax=Panicum miliaceum TaxID=4540 RepID=A0A3L6R6Z3_PANMI|nr:metacaspase-6-like [Panicum miliaceum]